MVDDLRYVQAAEMETELGKLSGCERHVIGGSTVLRQLGIGLAATSLLLIVAGVYITLEGIGWPPYSLIVLLLPGYGVYFCGSNLKAYGKVAAKIEAEFNKIDSSDRPDWG
jgi:hypothetical protein